MSSHETAQFVYAGIEALLRLLSAAIQHRRSMRLNNIAERRYLESIATTWYHQKRLS